MLVILGVRSSSNLTFLNVVENLVPACHNLMVRRERQEGVEEFVPYLPEVLLAHVPISPEERHGRVYGLGLR